MSFSHELKTSAWRLSADYLAISFVNHFSLSFILSIEVNLQKEVFGVISVVSIVKQFGHFWTLWEKYLFSVFETYFSNVFEWGYC